MTSNPFPAPKSYTPPKDEPTPSQADLEWQRRQLSGRQVNLQWAAVAIVGIVTFGLVVVCPRPRVRD